jgi:3,4-dihydroxy 2-butanone 4-phosphate synthase / GTP cyclohydrolase II
MAVNMDPSVNTMAEPQVTLDSIPDALAALRRGDPIVVVDDEDRENEGDFIVAADKVTPDTINFLAKQGRGLICLAATRERLRQLELVPMVSVNTARLATSFTASIDAATGITTGISAHDRAHTVAVFLDAASRPRDLARPGHVFPLEAQTGGVLRRAGHTEAAVDLSRMAGLAPAGVLCEIMDDDGSMARLPKLREVANAFGLVLVSIADLIAYRRRHEKLVRRETDVDLPTRSGDFRLVAYSTSLDQAVHLALVRGSIRPGETALVRVHSECLTGDVFHSLRCDCGEQMEAALEAIDARGAGVFLYMRQEGRGIGLVNKLKAYALQDEGRDTVEANRQLGFADDLRDYGVGAQILADLGVGRMELLTNNPRKVVGLEGYGLEIVARIPLEIVPNGRNLRYLQTKKEKLGHLLRGL